ncbi:FGGY family carbohydrate kinase [Asaia bogorensis]|uniref:FGGY family carbohydrate kinase n=1 Tax=Asaia bogorensis TaxID=91915 RepID=UPI00285B782C|nr:FGGY family carbohydrate kinase [Asaia bogorensis]MDR6182202.1 glycerol kinase [Asaia bogorensis NBRC 16594]
MKNTRQAVMAIDEGTSGTRSALVGVDGAVTALFYEPLPIETPRHGVVEQDASLVLRKTLSVCHRTIQEAREGGIEIISLAIANQRSTGVLWNKITGVPVAPAVVWQDTRYAENLAQIGKHWDDELFPITGRPVAGYALYYWAAQHIINTPAVTDAYRSGTLAFGTVDSWLLWNLSEDHILATTSTNATGAGGFDLRNNQYFLKWIDAQGFPESLLPRVLDESDNFGLTNSELLGIHVPIKASCGDQHGGMIGLGCLDEGQATCLHGTGSFVDLVTGDQFPLHTGSNPTTFSLIAWRHQHKSVFAVETYASTTGSALNWACQRMGWFKSAQEVSELAATVESSDGLEFMPALTGMRLPELCVEARASVGGLSMAHDRRHLAHAILEGIAHEVVSCMEASADVADIPVREIIVGGGLSASSTLLQLQADLGGIRVRHRPNSARATLRGAAFLAGSDGTLWDSLGDARDTLPEGIVYTPRLSESERQQRRAHWYVMAAAERARVASGTHRIGRV